MPNSDIEMKPQDDLGRICEHYPKFRQVLEELRKEIIERVDQEQKELAQQIMPGPGDDADISVIDSSASHFMKLADHDRERLLEIMDALVRLQRGTFGVCESCENSIAWKRLMHLPYSRYCVECQTDFERKKHGVSGRATAKL